MLMEHRSHIPKKLRDAFSKLHQLINQNKFIHGTLVYQKNTCGKKHCKCYNGQPHLSLYIRKSQDGKTRMKCVPKENWEEVKEMNLRYRQILTLLEQVSDYEWERLSL